MDSIDRAKFINMKEACHQTGESRGNVNFKISRQRFPKPTLTFKGSLYWRVEDIEAYKKAPTSWALNQAMKRLRGQLEPGSVRTNIDG
jgi:predicted DNA-binding transcriptional regulator AlpA